MPEIQFTVGAAGKPALLTLSGDCTIEYAIELKEAFVQAMGSSANLLVQIENVEAVDLSFLQMLCWAHRTSAKKNRRFRIGANPSDTFRNTVVQAGYLRSSGCIKGQECLWATEGRSPGPTTVQRGVTAAGETAISGGSVQ